VNKAVTAYQMKPIPLYPQGEANMQQDITKRLALKFPGGRRGTEMAIITASTTTRDLLTRLGLDPTGYEVLDGRNDHSFQLDEVLFARVADGDLVHISARIDVGKKHQL
jgi:hypothetical protein